MVHARAGQCALDARAADTLSSEWKQRTAEPQVLSATTECKNYTREQVARALPDIVAKFIEEARQESVQHAKLLVTMGGLDTPDVEGDVGRVKPESLAEMLTRSLERECSAEEFAKLRATVSR